MSSQDICGGPTPTPKQYYDHDEIFEQSINFIKAHTHPVRTDQVLRFCNLFKHHVDQSWLLSKLTKDKRIKYIEETETMEYTNNLHIRNTLELLGYLVLQGPGHEVHLGDICDGWWDCYRSIYELEKNGIVSITRNNGCPVSIKLARYWRLPGQSTDAPVSSLEGQHNTSDTEADELDSSYDSDGYDPEDPAGLKYTGSSTVDALEHSSTTYHSNSSSSDSEDLGNAD